MGAFGKIGKQPPVEAGNTSILVLRYYEKRLYGIIHSYNIQNEARPSDLFNL